MKIVECVGQEMTRVLAEDTDNGMWQIDRTYHVGIVYGTAYVVHPARVWLRSSPGSKD